MTLFYFGLIVEAMIDNGRGQTKPRPAVIVDSDEACQTGGPFTVVAITKSTEIPLPNYHFVVHNSTDKDPRTGLDFPCVAKCNWVRAIEERRILSRRGVMPDSLLTKISETLDRLLDDPSIPDEFWQ